MAKQIEKAKKLINEYVLNEFDNVMTKEDYKDLTEIGITFTTLDIEGIDYEVQIQVNVDLVNYAIKKYLDLTLVEVISYDSLEDLISCELEDLDFYDLIDLDDKITERYKKSLETEE